MTLCRTVRIDAMGLSPEAMFKIWVLTNDEIDLKPSEMIRHPETPGKMWNTRLPQKTMFRTFLSSCERSCLNTGLAAVNCASSMCQGWASVFGHYSVFGLFGFFNYSVFGIRSLFVFFWEIKKEPENSVEHAACILRLCVIHGIHACKFNHPRWACRTFHPHSLFVSKSNRIKRDAKVLGQLWLLQLVSPLRSLFEGSCWYQQHFPEPCVGEVPW